MDLFSDHAQNKIVDALFRGQALGAPATWHVALLKCTKGARANSTAYALNDTLGITAADGRIHLYKVTTPGTTAGSAPSFPGVAGEAITDGTAVLTEQSAAVAAGTALVEPSGGSYARVSIAASLAAWAGTQGAGTTVASSGTGGTTSNNAAITFPVPSADWCSGSERVWAWAMYDAASSGNCWYTYPLTALQAITNGQLASEFAAGALSITVGA